MFFPCSSTQEINLEKLDFAQVKIQIQTVSE